MSDDQGTLINDGAEPDEDVQPDPDYVEACSLDTQAPALTGSLADEDIEHLSMFQTVAYGASPTPWDKSTGLHWLLRMMQQGQAHWNGYCAGLAANSFGFGSSGANANDWYRHAIKGPHHSGGTPERGSLALFAGGQYGHAARQLGNGIALCNTEGGRVGRVPNSYYANIGPMIWIPVANLTKGSWALKLCSGSNPYA